MGKEAKTGLCRRRSTGDAVVMGTLTKFVGNSEV